MIKAVIDKIVVQEMKRKTSKGGLIIPDSVQQPQAFGVVMSIGETVKSPIKEGDVLIFHINGGMAMVVEGKILRCIMENEVYGIVNSQEIIDQLALCEIKQQDLDELDAALKKGQSGRDNSRIVRV
jgi:co-chaperonin GroES (HSP10)